ATLSVSSFPYTTLFRSLNVGTIKARKNALQIVKAITNIDTTLVLIGRKTDYWKEIEKYAKENNITHKIKHLPNISQRDLAIIYQLATVMAYPSVFEGFGIPIIEALYSKTPVITTNSGVFPEAGGPNSMYINPEMWKKCKLPWKNYFQMTNYSFPWLKAGGNMPKHLTTIGLPTT